MPAPKLDINDLIRKIPVAKFGRWAQANAEKMVFWILLVGLVGTIFMVYQSYQKPPRVLPKPKGGSSEAAASEVPLKPAAFRGAKYAPQYGLLTDRNPFVACEKIAVPEPAPPAIIYEEFVSDQACRLSPQQGGDLFDLTIGQPQGPWKLSKVEQDKITFQTRYGHQKEIKLNVVQEAPPSPAPKDLLFQGRQKDARGQLAAWVAPKSNPSAEKLVPQGFDMSGYSGDTKDCKGWVLQEVHEDRAVFHYTLPHRRPPRDVVVSYSDPPINITYTGQSRMGEKWFAHFKVMVMDARGKSKEQSGIAMEGEGIEKTSFKLEKIALEQVTVSRGERQYTLQLKQLQAGAEAPAPGG